VSAATSPYSSSPPPTPPLSTRTPRPSTVRRRPSPFMAVDLLAWAVAAAALAVVLAGTAHPVAVTVVLGATAALAHVGGGLLVGLYRHGPLTLGLDEARRLALATLGASAAASAALLVSSESSARSWPVLLPLLAGPGAFVVAAALRVVHRRRVEAGLRPGVESQPALVLGAGMVGQHLVRQLLTDPGAAYRPVGLVDDDPVRLGTSVAGVKVLGGVHDLRRAVDRTGARALLLAVPHADASTVRDVTDRATALGLRVASVPTLGELQATARPVTALRDVTLEDLVGRRPVDTDVTAVAECVRGRRVLVTGAGGSIGSELCRQLAGFSPAELVLLDRDETALQSVQVRLHGHGLLDTREVVLADIRDPVALAAVFRARRPEVVFHAAALKHLPMLEQYPGEAWQTNVMGTLNVLEAAEDVGVETFVNVSTDKAANPTSVLGRSKRLAERLTAASAERTGRRYLSVRFGNVFGSRGSLVPLFTELIEAGRPLTVTHPDATRFFMSIPEACQLVVQAGAIGAPGEVLVLDMGEPVRILEIAERMRAMAGRGDLDIVFTGLRPGEKLHEELTGVGESDHRPVHPSISHTTVPPLAACELDVDALTGSAAGPAARSAAHDADLPGAGGAAGPARTA